MSGHVWRFFRAGGVDQVQLTTAKDLLALDQLDQKLWVALACPVKGLELDERTLQLLDTDADGRVNAKEIIAAAKWAGALLKDPEILAKRGGELPLSAIDTSNDEGKVLHDTAKALLVSLDKADATTLALADVKDAIEKFNTQRWNGDGVVPASSTDDEAEKKAIVDVLSCTEAPATDKNGDPGITADSVKAFFEELDAYVAWLDAGQSDAVRLLGDASADAFSAYEKVRAKVDDFFTRCRVAAFDARALVAVNREESEYLAAAAKDLQITADEVAHFPLAHIESDAKLPLEKRLNPAWIDAMDVFRQKVVAPLLGDRAELSHDEWMTIRSKLGAHAAWVKDKKGLKVDPLGPERARELTKGFREKLDALLAKDEAARPMAEAREKVEKLLHLNRDLMIVANNFVSFRNFYERKGPASFQIGTLYIDQRSCELCIRVNDAGKHATMAAHSKAYLLYCDLKSASGETMQVAAAMTNGDVDNLMVGRNGLFYDRKGNAWDATVTRIVENPLSVRQAFWTPYKKFLRLVEEQMERRAQAAQAEADANVTAAAEQTDQAASGQPRPPATPRKLDIGVVAAIGVAVGGITAAIGALLQAFFGLGFWMPLGVLGLMLLISGPSMAIAYLKLRQRNLGPLLDANGWAVNAKAKVNVPFGESLTKVATIPKGSQRDLHDPFAEKKRPWKFYVFVLLLLGLALGYVDYLLPILAIATAAAAVKKPKWASILSIVFGLSLLVWGWYVGKLDTYLPENVRSTTVLGEAAPANVRVVEEEAAAEDAAQGEAAPTE